MISEFFGFNVRIRIFVWKSGFRVSPGYLAPGVLNLGSKGLYLEMKGGKMRLEEHEIASIKRCAERHFGPNCAVRLFGSRADDARRGGDIDLHVQVDDDAVATMACRVRYLSDLEAALGERKIDLVVEGPARKNGYIDSVARESGVLL